MVAKELDHFQPDPSPALSPVLIEVDNESGEYTRLKIVSEDTPAFLYSLTQAFSLHGIAIEHVQIRTREGQISDEIDVVDANGRRDRRSGGPQSNQAVRPADETVHLFSGTGPGSVLGPASLQEPRSGHTRPAGP